LILKLFDDLKIEWAYRGF